MPRDSIEVIRMRGAKAAFGESQNAKFGKAAAAAPFTLRSLGLGSGIATLAATKGEEHTKLAVMIAKWLIDGDDHWTFPGVTRPENASDENWIRALLAAIATSTRNDYRTAQIEAMGYVGWIKKLAKAFCPDEDV